MTLLELGGWSVLIVRWCVGAGFVVAATVAATHWAVRAGHLTPFSAWPRFVRGWSDPLLLPVEQRVLRAGGNPQSAPLWLLGIVVVGGLILIQLVGWLFRVALGIQYAISVGLILPMLVSTTFSILQAALLIRIIASWFAVSPYSTWMRVVRGLTDWILEPIQRVLPRTGMLDFSPLVAWLLLSLAARVVVGWMTG